jgi:replicative DNA helicase
MNSYRRIMQMKQDAPRIRSGEIEVPPLIPTGIGTLDKILNGGLPRHKLCVIAARTSHGKTATAVRFAVNIALTGRKVNVFWLEDDETEFDMRAIAVLARTPLPQVQAAYRSGTLDDIIDRIPKDRMDKWMNIRTVWMEKPYVAEVCEKIEMASKNSVVLIDHLGEIAYDKGQKFEVMGDGLRMIRASQRKAECLVVAMTQLNRDWDRRRSQSENPDQVRPVLSDIENSGQIEQIARVCIIAEKRHIRQGDADIPNGAYFYHLWKPYSSISECRWDDRTSTPENPEPIQVDPPIQVPAPWCDAEQDDD